MLYFIILGIFLRCSIAEWLQIRQEFINITNSTIGWSAYYRTSQYSEVTPNTYIRRNYCPNNNKYFVQLDFYYFQIYKYTYQPRIFRTQIIMDVIYDLQANVELVSRFQIWLNSSTQTTSLLSYYFYQPNLVQKSNRICNSIAPYPFQYKTFVSTPTTINGNAFYLDFYYTAGQKLQDFVGLQYLLVYVELCSSKCQTCTGPDENQCSTCHYGTLQPSGSCTCHYLFRFAMKGQGCLSECPRNYYVANSEICIPDRRIQGYNSYFTFNISSTFSPLEFLPDPLFPTWKDVTLRDYHYDIYGLGYFQYSEGITLQLDQINALAFIRLRLTLQLINMEIGSRINILLDNNVLSAIIKISSSIQLENAISIQKNETFSTTNIRLETILLTNNISPRLTIKGQMTSTNAYWWFYNMTIDSGVCKEFCQVCSDINTCSECITGYVVYQGGCVLNSCPIYSQDCVDYSDEYPYSQYLAKGFYDFNMTLDQINTFYDSVTNSESNFKTDQKFSFFPTKIMLGGLLVWYNASYVKNFTIPKPHYAISIRFNFTFGDEYPGEFYYYLDTNVNGPFTLPITGQNIIGKTSEERTQYFYNFYTHNQLTFVFELKCVAPDLFDIRDGFCAVSEYFIVVHYCQPFCLDCSDSITCNTWQSGYLGTDIAPDDSYYDTTLQIYVQYTCSQIGCLSCNQNNFCSQCSVVDQFQLNNGICSCGQSSYLAETICVSCDIYCENCFGPNSNDCASCVKEQNRVIQGNTCVCIEGFIDDWLHIVCSPVCGDAIIVKGEDCDDGNNNPFDGCDLCKFSCSQECDLCVLGICESCMVGYYLIQNSCFPICHNNLIPSEEMCNAINLTTNEVCVECIYEKKCSKYCTICQRGVCLKCQENNGWYLQEDNSCQPICGDLIISKPYEACDDGNNDAYDGCHQCLMTCGKYCDKCLRGQCTTCQKGYQLSVRTRQCVSNCGDKIRTIQEECDDGNNIKYDGCYKCHVNCQPACTNCTLKGCSECNTAGWEYNKIEKKCETKCGDGIIVHGQEECDDAISENCYQCKFTCQESCILCYFGKCEKCQVGWVLNKIDQNCYTITGDSLVLGSEQCDDFNFIENDGCSAPFFSCQTSCQICLNGNCQFCKQGYLVSNGLCYQIPDDGLIVGQEQCDDGNYLPYDGCYENKFDCPLYCKYCIRGLCLQCNQQSGFGYLDIQNNRCLASFLDMDTERDLQLQLCQKECNLCENGKCFECHYGYYLNQKTNQCVSYCGDLIVSGNEQCDDGNNDLSDGCENCQLQCDDHCQLCVNGQCQKCRTYGYSLNPLNKRCETFCGDKIVAGLEVCDDGNDKAEDGCYLCEFECQKSCTQCFAGVCLKCSAGWKIGKSEIDCEPICGDNIIIKGYEDCDDGNSVPFDGCFDCKYQCQDQCTDCQKGVCYACDTEGWNISDHLCYPVCGDGYIVSGLEDCDDGNNIKHDGCYQCSYQCEELCTMCDKGICQECNHLGWLIEKNVCTPFCGDGLVKGNEQCDDMNELENDGCYNCQYQCDEFCIDCLDGLCVECQEYRYVKRNVCLAECGDSKFVQFAEQCDDGNDNNHDGCNSKCQIEEDWICSNAQGTISTCFYTQKPQIQLKFLSNDAKNIYHVKLSFTQLLKRSPNTQGEITNYIIPSISNLEPKQYQIIQEQNQQINTYETMDLIILFQIQYHTSIRQPILNVEIIDNPFLSEYNLTLKENKEQLSLPTPSILSEAQNKIALSAQAFNRGVIYSLAGVSSLCVLTGSSDLFWNLMDQLQYLSYIKYINIQFPSNLEIYFDTFKLITISPMITTLKLDYLFAMIDGQEEYHINTTGKFFNDSIDAYFLTNFQSTLFFFISGFIMYFVTKNIYFFLMNISQYRRFCHLKIQKIMVQIRGLLYKQYSSFFYNGILRILMSNWYDLSFASAIQLAYYQGERSAYVLNYSLSIIIYVGQFLATLILIGVVNKFAKKQSLSKKNKFEALFENVRRSPNLWTVLYNPLLLFKKQVFISLLVFMQQQGQIQALCIAVFQTCFLSYLLLNRPLRNIFELKKLICTEFLIILNSISFLLYAYQKELSLAVDLCISFGWFHIFTSTTILGVSLFFDLIQQSKILINKLKKNTTKKISQQELQNRLAIFF